MIRRDEYLEKIKKSMWDNNVKVITGIRRCGKSTLLFDLFGNYLSLLDFLLEKVELF